MRNASNFAGFLAAAILIAPAAQAQAPEPPAPIVREAMAKLAWLEGDWTGEAWYNSPGGRTTHQVSERAHFHLDGLVLVVHGRGWSVAEDGTETTVHKAFGVLSYDSFRKTYQFDAFVKDGYQSRSNPEVGDHSYRWSYAAGPGTEMRYHARLEGDVWVESGERCVEDKCTPMMEMRLTKKPAE